LIGEAILAVMVWLEVGMCLACVVLLVFFDFALCSGLNVVC
jgi:hypothetical protein